MSIGNIIIGQSGGPTAAINASLAGAFKAAKDMGAKKIYGMINGIQGLLEQKTICLTKYIKSDIEIELLKRTPSSYLGSCRYKMPPLESNDKTYIKLFKILKDLDIKCFLYIGGNDSMDTLDKLSAYANNNGIDISFIGIPKTIDNDLMATDHTPGYGSAAKFIATAVKEIVCDSSVYDTKSVTVIEIMGRNAGWLTAACALAKSDNSPGADMIYLPENAFDKNEFLQNINDAQKKKKSLVIAISEGIKLANGQYLCEDSQGAVQDVFGHKYLGRTANLLSDFIHSELGCKTRGIELNTLQRCASHIASKTDIDEAYLAGKMAVKASCNGETGKMVTFVRHSNSPYQISTSTQDISKIANAEKTVPSEWITNNGTYVSKELIDYIKPLIQGELAPIMVDSLPYHLTFDKNFVNMGCI